MATNHTTPVLTTPASASASASAVPSPLKPVPDGYVRLISGDGYEFLVEIKHAIVSKVIKKMLESDFREARTREIRFPDVEAEVLEKVCQRMYYLPRQISLKATAKDRDHRVIEPFPIPKHLTVKILLFASFLDL